MQVLLQSNVMIDGVSHAAGTVVDTEAKGICAQSLITWGWAIECPPAPAPEPIHPFIMPDGMFINMGNVESLTAVFEPDLTADNPVETIETVVEQAVEPPTTKPASRKRR